MNKKRINYEDLILLFWHPKDIPIPEKIEEVITKIRNEGKQQAKKEFLEIIDKYKKYQKESEYEFEDIVVSVEMLKKEVEKISNKTRDIAGYMGGSIAGACRNKEK